MADVQLWPQTPLIDQYLSVAYEDHPGHKLLDLAVLYAILQNYTNRFNIRLLGQPFQVHFFLIGASSFGKSCSLSFGFKHFLPAYRTAVNGPNYDDHFINVSGQHTAAGLMDVFNSATDRYKRQLATVWAHETVRLFPINGGGKHSADVHSLFENIFLGNENVRYVREKTSRNIRDSIDNPLINACLAATKEQYPEFMKSSSSGLLRNFFLVSPDERDRDPWFLTKYGKVNLPSVVDTFVQWLNVMELSAQATNDPLQLTITPDARALITSQLKSKFGSHTPEEERAFFRSKRNQIAMLMGLNALARCKFEIDTEDALCAWNFGELSWAHVKQLDDSDKDISALSTVQRQRADVVMRILRCIEKAGRKGTSDRDLYMNIYAMRFLSLLEKEALIKYIQTEFSEEIFDVNVEIMRKNGRPLNKVLHFSVKTWSPEEAVVALPVARPTWVSEGGFRDALGKVHAELRDCAGYKPEWEAEVSKGISSAN
jgi:hypothetical protein